MKLNELRPNTGATKNKKRIGRGPGSGNGKTAGRGMNGQKSRSGYSRKRGFEGGQMPLNRRLPKRGFDNPFRKIFVVINLDLLAKLNVEQINLEDYAKFGLVKNYRDGIKILGNGEIDRAIVIQANKFSESAKAKIEKAGGQAVEV
jgi:large subunit ribosomal protein L15